MTESTVQSAENKLLSLRSLLHPMETCLPSLDCLLQLALRSLCSSSYSSKWVYAVFWRILPRNFPPPKCEFGGNCLDRSKGNKRNWILVWEDGYCDFYECDNGGSGYDEGRFGAGLFFKMSHEVYNYGEGAVGKVAADNSHKWVFRDSTNEEDPIFISSWNAPFETLPRAWDSQFKSGIQTISVIAVRDGIIQLGSFDKIPEDLTLVMSIQRKFSYLQTIPGIFAIQRPYLPAQPPYIFKPNTEIIQPDHCRSTGVKRLYGEVSGESPIKSINLGWNTPHSTFTASPMGPLPPILPPSSSGFGAPNGGLPLMKEYRNGVKFEVHRHFNAEEEAEAEPISANPSLGVEDNPVAEFGFGVARDEETRQRAALRLN